MSDIRELSYFTKRYAFIDSVRLTGDFDKATVLSKSMVNDCNFNFNSDSVTTHGIDEMFDGCENAVFMNRLVINDDVLTSASFAFRDCKNAKLPFVDIGESKISNSESMFENCYSAELEGVQIPSSSKRFRRMFRNCKTAFFNDISEIPSGDGDYTELFSGCENGVFSNLSFSKNEGTLSYRCSGMFYYCSKMDAGHLEFENVSVKLSDSSYMFFSAGRNGSNTFDDSVFRFSSLERCEKMFSSSNFSFNDAFFAFDGNNESYNGRTSTSTVTSVSNMFSGCEFCGGRSPVVILGHPNDGEFDISSIDSTLNRRIYGYYGNKLENSILNFSSLYENSKFEVLDLRGISNNTTLMNYNFGGVRDFSNMCRGCTELKEIVGFIPSNARTYESMFDGCSSLSADLCRIFLNQYVSWNEIGELETAFDKDSEMVSYMMNNVSNMFRGCGRIYSSSDVVDLVGLFKRMKSNVSDSNSFSVFEAVDGMFPPICIATKNAIPGFRNSNYEITNISRDTGTIRYNSFEDEPFEVYDSGDFSEFGLYSEYAKHALKSGFYRYGGIFMGDDNDKCFFILYYPKVDSSTGNVVGFEKRGVKSGTGLIPHGWGDRFNVDSRKGYWSDFSFDMVYAGMICDLHGNFIKYAYVGNYTRIYHEKRVNAGGSFELVKNYEMPVTYFDGMEDSISIL